MLLFFFIFLLSSILIIFFIKEQDVTFLRSFSLISSGLIFVYSVSLLLLFDCNDYYFQFLIRYFFNFEAFNICFTFGLDGISLFFCINNIFNFFMCIICV